MNDERLTEPFDRRPTAPPPEQLINSIERQVSADLKPVRPLAPARYFLAAFAIIFVAVTAIGAVYLHAFGTAAMNWLQMTAVFTTLAASAALLAFSLVSQMAPGSRQLLPPALLPIGSFILLLLVIALVFQMQSERDFVAHGLACLKAGVTFAVPSALAFWLLLRRGAMLAPRLAGATAGILAGLVGTSVLEIHCPNMNMMHIAIWHLAPALLGAIAGLGLGALGEAIARQ